MHHSTEVRGEGSRIRHLTIVRTRIVGFRGGAENVEFSLSDLLHRFLLRHVGWHLSADCLLDQPSETFGVACFNGTAQNTEDGAPGCALSLHHTRLSDN